MSEDGKRTFYLLVCRQCGDPERSLPIPFDSPAERGKWAAEHTSGTGHDRWIVRDEQGPVTSDVHGA
jgi:hypothetical protein